MNRVVIVTAIALAGFATVRAQPISTSAPSIEWAAATSCVVVRGVIDDIAVHEQAGGLYGDVGDNQNRTITVRVLETLKGEHSDRLRFVQDHDAGRTRLARLQEDRQELLVFLEPWMHSERFRRASGGYAFTRFPYVVKHIVVLTADDCRWAARSVPLLSANLTRLSTPQQTIATVRTFLAVLDDRRQVRSTTMQLPPEVRGRVLSGDVSHSRR